MPLNIDLQQILLHLLNFVILFGGLYFLLYKPVNKFMNEREAQYLQRDQESAAKMEEIRKAEEKYQQEVENLEVQLLRRQEEASKEIEKVTRKRMQEAELMAEEIIGKARQEGEREREKIIQSAQSSISEMVAEATEKMILGTSATEAFDQFLTVAEKGDDSHE